MSRRPKIIDDLTHELSQTPQEVPDQRAKPKPRAPEVVHTSLYIPRPAYRKLQEIALTADKKVHDLILDGIDRVLQENGHAPTERRKRGPKPTL